MPESCLEVAIAGFIAITIMACRQAEPASQHASLGRSCPPVVALATTQPLACYVDAAHQLQVGNAGPSPIPQGTTISFAARRTNPDCTPGPFAYCASVALAEPIPPHLFVAITGQPPFDDQAPCQAWRDVPPVATQ